MNEECVYGILWCVLRDSKCMHPSEPDSSNSAFVVLTAQSRAV